MEALKGPAPYPFGFHGVEERFHMGIILAVIGPVHADQETVALQSIDIGSTTIFYASIRVEDAARSRPALFEGMREGSGGEPHGAIFPQGPAEYLPRIDIHDGCQEALLAWYSEKGHVSDPLLVNSCRNRLREAKIGMAFIEALHPGCAAGYFYHAALKTSFSHEPGYAILTAGYTVFLEGLKDAWTAIGLVAFLVNSDDLLQKSSV